MSIRMIHVGVGGRGKWPVARIAEREDYTSVALVDVNEDNLAAAREVSGLGEEVCFNDMNEAMEIIEADAVVVVTPPDMHAGQCLAAVQGGKHVIVEKPFTKNLSEAAQVIREAEERGLKVAVCQNARFIDPVYSIHKLVKDGTYGAPSFGLITKYGWRPNTHHSGHDVHSYLWERGIHDFDATLFMFGKRPKRVWCHDFNPSWSPYPGGGGIHACIEFEDGATCGFLCTFAAHSDGASLRIEFEKGTLQQVGRELHLTRPGEKESETLPLSAGEVPEMILLNGFRDYINEGNEPSFSGPNNLATVGLVEALGEASQRGEVIDFEGFMNERTS